MDKKNGKSSVAERIKKLKHKEIIIAVIAVVIMLVIYFSSFSFSGSSVNEETSGSLTSDYCRNMETQVTDAVVKMSGDKSAKVIVNWETSVEAVIAYSTSGSQNSSSSSPTIVQNGKPVVLKEIYPKPLGIVVVFAGGDNVKLRLDIIGMVSTLMDISPEKVAVYGAK